MGQVQKSIKQVAEERQALRKECRAMADQLMAQILAAIDKMGEEQQRNTLSMLMTELSISLKKAV